MLDKSDLSSPIRKITFLGFNPNSFKRKQFPSAAPSIEIHAAFLKGSVFCGVVSLELPLSEVPEVPKVHPSKERHLCPGRPQRVVPMAFVGSPFLSSGCASLRKRPRSTLSIAQVSMHLDAHPASKPLFEALRKPVRVALTREEEKNIVLDKNLRLVYPTIEIVHTPCIETTSAEHTNELPERLRSTKFDWIVITSPEGASVFVKAWKKANFPEVGKFMVVGKATGDVLKAVGFKISFMPSKAAGKTLVEEFPSSLQGETVLYPASAKASNVIVEGLSRKGYSVLRLNTYSTETACFNDKLRWLAEGAHIVTFASPSAVKGWIQNVDVEEEIAVACIGSTSANAAKAAGFRRVHYPEKPGMEGWISAVSDAMKLYESKEL